MQMMSATMSSLPQGLVRRAPKAVWRIFSATSWIAAMLFLCLPGTGHAGSVSLTSDSIAILNPGSGMIISFGTWTYSAANPGYSPDPTTLTFEALGPQITTSLSAIPGTSEQYFSGYSVTGYLASLDGSVMTPLIDQNARRLGLPDGTLLLQPGTLVDAAGSQQVAMLSASVALSQGLAQSLFGAGANQAWTSDAQIVIQNAGPAITFGIGSGYTLKSAFLEVGLGGAGPATTSGVTIAVDSTTSPSGVGTNQTSPEPGTQSLVAAGLVAVLGLTLRARKFHLSR